MKFAAATSAIALTLLSLTTPIFSKPTANGKANLEKKQKLWGNTDFVKRAYNSSTNQIKPKMFIISMFDPEAEVWFGIDEFDLYEQNITLPGLSPLFPEVHCTMSGDICQFTIGESGK